MQNESVQIAKAAGQSAGAQGDFAVQGGVYILSLDGTVPATGNQLNLKQSGGYIPVKQTGTAPTDTAGGAYGPLYLAAGTYNLTLGTAPAANAFLTRLPN